MSIQKSPALGHLACFAAYTIFGFNIVICKDLSNLHIISPLGLFCFRAIGATLLFWLVSLFTPKEKVPKLDLLKIFAASMLGLYITQLTFLIGITKITPLDCSILSSISPIFTMFVAAVALKEPITLKKAGGVTLSFCGVIFLIINSISLGGGAVQTKPIGILLMLLNGVCFALYLGFFKPLISKYHVVTFMKWMFLFSALASVPFDAKELINLDYASLPKNCVMELLYLIIFSTFTAYFLIPIGQKLLRPTVLSLYSYLQPIIASIISIYIGMDTLNWQKVVAAIAVFVGVILVNKSRAAGANINTSKQ